MRKIIGIIGGVGPYAGLDVNEKVFANTVTSGKDQDHLEVYLLSRSSDIGDRTKYIKTLEGENPGEGLYRSLKKLATIGADVAGIPCNTAHAPVIINLVKKKADEEGLNIKLLHMIEETRDFILNIPGGIKKVGLLCTLGTYEAKIYQGILEKSGIEVIVPDQKGKEKVHQAIYDEKFGVKAKSSPICPEAIALFIEVAEELRNKGAEVMILGCTEIPLAINKDNYDKLPLIDPTNILARALVREADPSVLKDF